MINRPVVAAAVTFAIALAGCSDGLKQHIRERDFRAFKAEKRPVAAASPIANVADMPGWTTDLESAMAFATENGQRTVIFAQQPGSPATRTAANVLNSGAAGSVLDGKQKVTFDASTAPEMAERFQIRQLPALIVLDAAGTVVAQQQGTLSKDQIMRLIR